MFCTNYQHLDHTEKRCEENPTCFHCCLMYVNFMFKLLRRTLLEGQKLFTLSSNEMKEKNHACVSESSYNKGILFAESISDSNLRLLYDDCPTHSSTHG